jgi:hypothetical protein
MHSSGYWQLDASRCVLLIAYGHARRIRAVGAFAVVGRDGRHNAVGLSVPSLTGTSLWPKYSIMYLGWFALGSDLSNFLSYQLNIRSSSRISLIMMMRMRMTMKSATTTTPSVRWFKNKRGIKHMFG